MKLRWSVLRLTHDVGISTRLEVSTAQTPESQIRKRERATVRVLPKSRLPSGWHAAGDPLSDSDVLSV